MSSTPACRLCAGKSHLFYKAKRTYFQCKKCASVFVSDDALPESHKELERYETHNNDVNDPGYQKFVSPIVSYIKKHFSPDDQGLDYGAGPGPVITSLLEKGGFHNISLYDPFFADNPSVLERQYDFIICCEVMEHFHSPAEEFERLSALLKPNGALVCMTDLYDESVDFKSWYYINDITHVFFYHSKALAYIQRSFGFRDYFDDGRLVVFRK